MKEAEMEGGNKNNKKSESEVAEKKKGEAGGTEVAEKKKRSRTGARRARIEIE